MTAPASFPRGARLALLALLSPLATKPVAQGLPTPLPPSNPAPLVYCPPERLSAGPRSPYHVLNVFLPRGPVPASGWPVVVGTGYGGAASVPPAPSLASTGPSASYWNLVAAGIAVVHFGAPGVGNNRGLWYPPGHPSGRHESFLPAHDNPEKAAEWVVKWVKVQTLYPFDLARIALRGSSGGAVLAIRTAMGPERARATGSAQLRASTRVAAVLAIQPPTSAWALEQGPELTIPFPKHLEQAAFPGVAAAVLEQVDPELQRAYSLMREAFASAEALANNVRQPLCLVYGDPVLRVGGQVATFALDASGFPVLHDLVKQPLQHDSWFGYVFWKRLIELSSASAEFHAANSVFAMRDIYALKAPLAYHTRTYAGTVMGAQANRIGHDWLVARLLGPQETVMREPPPAPLGLAAAPPPAPVPVHASDLVLLEGTPRPGARLVLGLRGPAGALALLALSRPPGATPARLGLDPRALLARPRFVRLGPEPSGFTPVALEIPPRPELAGYDLFVQALVSDGQRLRPGDSFVLSLEPPRARRR